MVLWKAARLAFTELSRRRLAVSYVLALFGTAQVHVAYLSVIYLRKMLNNYQNTCWYVEIRRCTYTSMYVDFVH